MIFDWLEKKRSIKYWHKEKYVVYLNRVFVRLLRHSNVFQTIMNFLSNINLFNTIFCSDNGCHRTRKNEKDVPLNLKEWFQIGSTNNFIYQQLVQGNGVMELLSRGSKRASHQPNCQTNSGFVLLELFLIFCIQQHTIWADTSLRLLLLKSSMTAEHNRWLIQRVFLNLGYYGRFGVKNRLLGLGIKPGLSFEACLRITVTLAKYRHFGKCLRHLKGIWGRIVTRFVQISPLWQHIKALWAIFLMGYLAKLWIYFGNFRFL